RHHRAVGRVPRAGGGAVGHLRGEGRGGQRLPGVRRHARPVGASPAETGGPDGGAGSVMRTVVPPPGVGTIRAVPPCAATSADTIARPRPAPPEARAREASSR